MDEHRVEIEANELRSEGEIDVEAGASDEAGGRSSPMKALRRHCLDCCGGSSNEVALCVSKSCPLWAYRFGRGPADEAVAAVAEVETHPAEAPMTQGELNAFTALRAIRRRCIDCSSGSIKGVTACTHTGCDLHAHRMRRGSKKLTGDALEASRLHLAAIRAIPAA